MDALEQILTNQITIMQALSALLHQGGDYYQICIDERIHETKELLKDGGRN